MTGPDVHLRLAEVADADAFVELHHACWREAYADLMPLERIDAVFADRAAAVARRREHLADPDRPTWLALRDDDPVGFATAGPPRQPDPPAPLELFAIYTRASVWGSGLGRALLSASVGELASYLWVLEGNERAIGFYRRHGFELDGATDDHPEGLHLRMVRG